MSLALLCSGQGLQGPGMFALTRRTETASLFAQAKALLGGQDPVDVAGTAASAFVHANRTGQILCVLQAVAACAALRRVLPPQYVVAGYSVGELAAWAVAGCLDAHDALALTAARAEAMDAVAPPGSGMLFVRGLAREAIDELCTRYAVAVAIVNPADAYVLAGNRRALAIVAMQAQRLGAAHVADVDVNVPSHTPAMAAASPRFRAALAAAPPPKVPPPGVRLLCGVDAAPVLAVNPGLDALARQLSEPVQWAACLARCVEAGATHFLELGPGSALRAMAAHAFPGAVARALDDFRTMEGAAAWVGAIATTR